MSKLILLWSYLFMLHVPWFTSKVILHWALYSCYMYLGLWASWYCIELFIHVTCSLVYEQVDIALSYLFMLHVPRFMSKLILHRGIYSCYMFLVYELVDIALGYLFMLHVPWFMSKLILHWTIYSYHFDSWIMNKMILHWAIYSCYTFFGLWTSIYCIELFIHVTVKILNFQTDQSGQTKLTQGLHCLLLRLHHFDKIPYGLASLFEF